MFFFFFSFLAFGHSFVCLFVLRFFFCRIQCLLGVFLHLWGYVRCICMLPLLLFLAPSVEPFSFVLSETGRVVTPGEGWPIPNAAETDSFFLFFVFNLCANFASNFCVCLFGCTFLPCLFSFIFNFSCLLFLFLFSLSFSLLYIFFRLFVSCP